MLWPKFHEQLMAALFFTLIIAAVFAAGVWVMAAALYRKLAHKPAPKHFRWTRRIIVVLAVAGLLCVAYGYFIEPYWLEVTYVRLETDKLPPGSRPIRIVQVSDLHCEAKERLEGDLPYVIAARRPDLIAFTGDAINSKAGIARFRRCLEDFSAIAPTFVVQGNSDLWYGLDDCIKGTGATELTGQAVKMVSGDTEFYVVGATVGDWNKAALTLLALPPGALKIVLYHYPDEIPSAARLGADLMLAGHTHGGQVAMPFYGAIVTLAAHGKRYESGLYHVGRMYAYVNRGIGMEGGIVPRVRFLARPEVTVIDLVPPSR
ncbi:MAG: metallophosphoesterase [Phycisphaerae bacterium]|jgi:predicted MPP superfamily phosphohydrolase